MRISLVSSMRFEGIGTAVAWAFTPVLYASVQGGMHHDH